MQSVTSTIFMNKHTIPPRPNIVKSGSSLIRYFWWVENSRRATWTPGFATDTTLLPRQENPVTYSPKAEAHSTPKSSTSQLDKTRLCKPMKWFVHKKYLCIQHHHSIEHLKLTFHYSHGSHPTKLSNITSGYVWTRNQFTDPRANMQAFPEAQLSNPRAEISSYYSDQKT